MVRKFLLGIAILGVSAAYGQTDMDGSFPAEAGITLEQMHGVISAEFLEPTSAQYRRMTLLTTSGQQQVICGWVNARNSLGGYAPVSPFVYAVGHDWGMVVQPELLNGTAASRELALTVLTSSGCPAATLGLE